MKGLKVEALGGILEQISERWENKDPMRFYAYKMAAHICFSYKHHRGRAVNRLKQLGSNKITSSSVYRRAARVLENHEEVF